jgi:hypothetical protein
MTSLHILGGNMTLRDYHHQMSPEAGEKLRPHKKKSGPRRKLSNKSKGEVNDGNTSFASGLEKATELYFFDSISSLGDASFYFDDDESDVSHGEHDEDDTTSNVPDCEGIPGLTPFIDDLKWRRTDSTSRWETEMSHDFLPSSPRRRSFELQRTVDRQPRSPRRASCDELQRTFCDEVQRACCDEVQRACCDELQRTVDRQPRAPRRASCDTLPVVPLRHYESDRSDTTSVPKLRINRKHTS